MNTIRNSKRNRRDTSTMISCLVAAFTLLAGSLSASDAQFLPQSNLGRLVQSIAGSPLVLGLPHASASMSSFDSDSPSSGYNGDGESPSNFGPGPAGYFGPGSDRDFSPQRFPAAMPQHNAPLQQAPSQQHRIPQRYHGAARSQQHQQHNQNIHQLNNNNNNQQDANDDDEPRSSFDQGRSPSNARPSQDYQMGAYLGPTMDDKELNGVFNSNNDDRDDVDSGPGAGYDDGPSEVNQREASSHKQHSSNNNNNNNHNNHYGSGNNDDESGAYQPFAHNGRQQHQSNLHNQAGHSGLGYDSGSNAAAGGYGGNDEESADEDESAPAAPLRANDGYPRVAAAATTKGAIRGGNMMTNGPMMNLGAAASQYQNQNYRQPEMNGRNNQQQQQRQYYQQQQQNQQLDSDDQERRLPSRGQMMVAANAYAPFGYGASGPVDLSSIMAGLAGEPNQQGYQVYQGDGSAYPGQGYYNQQGNNRQNARHQQAASRNNNGYFPNSSAYGPNGNNDDSNNGYSEDAPRSAASGSGANKRGRGENRDNDDGENEADED